MRFEKCPLMFTERTSWDVAEYELMCAATMQPTVDSVRDIDDAGCCRTNKWIMSRNREALIAAWAKAEVEAWEKYAKEKGWID